MEWKYYWPNVVRCYQVIIEGWPEKIPFANLSQASSAFSELQNLLKRWQDGDTYWKKLMEVELDDLEMKRMEKIQSGEIQLPPPHHRGSDYGKKRTHSPNSEAERCQTKKYKSASTVADASDEDDSADPDAMPGGSSSAATAARLSPDIPATL